MYHEGLNFMRMEATLGLDVALREAKPCYFEFQLSRTIPRQPMPQMKEKFKTVAEVEDHGTRTAFSSAMAGNKSSSYSYRTSA